MEGPRRLMGAGLQPAPEQSPYNGIPATRMDPLTHTATGLFLSRAGLNRWTPLATPILLLAANAPDIDILAAAGGPLNYLHYHRHLTHSLVALPVLAVLSVLVVRAASRKPLRWAGALAAAALGVGSHLLLDWTNMYGLRALLPFSSEWLRLDLTSIVDLWIWAVLLISVAGPFIARLVGSEISSGNVKGRPTAAASPFSPFFSCWFTTAAGVSCTRAPPGPWMRASMRAPPRCASPPCPTPPTPFAGAG